MPCCAKMPRLPCLRRCHADVRPCLATCRLTPPIFFDVHMFSRLTPDYFSLIFHIRLPALLSGSVACANIALPITPYPPRKTPPICCRRRYAAREHMPLPRRQTVMRAKKRYAALLTRVDDGKKSRCCKSGAAPAVRVMQHYAPLFTRIRHFYRCSRFTPQPTFASTPPGVPARAQRGHISPGCWRSLRAYGAAYATRCASLLLQRTCLR